MGVGQHLRLDFVDSHTGGEPTRVIVDGFPPLCAGDPAAKRDDLADRFATLAHSIVAEPRGNEAMVGALLLPPVDPSCVAGVIFFDRSAMLGMCGHGTIGLVETLRHLGRIGPGTHRIETPVGTVAVELGDDGAVTLANVVSRRLHHAVAVHVDGVGDIVGDIAWGGNTFYLVTSPLFDLDQGPGEILNTARAILDAVHDAGHDEVDHVELEGSAVGAEADARNFVLCPSGTYDRSPCGTGTSAKVACLAADGILEMGAVWVQESITGSMFSARYEWADRTAGAIVPFITGGAEVIAQGTLLFGPDEEDR